MNSRLLTQNIGVGGVQIKGPLEGISTIGDVINILIPFIMSLAGVMLFLVLIWGGYDVMMSQGTPEKMKSGRAKITAGVVGFVLLILSYFFAKLLSYIFNIGQGIL